MKALTLKDTDVLKGVAILLLLLHHCLSPDMVYDDVSLLGHPVFENVS